MPLLAVDQVNVDVLPLNYSGNVEERQSPLYCTCKDVSVIMEKCFFRLSQGRNFSMLEVLRNGFESYTLKLEREPAETFRLYNLRC